MKKIKEILMPLFYILITVILVTNFIIEVSTTTVYADVGSFEDYSSSGSSSSDWGSSSWGSSSSSWDSSSSGGSLWDSDSSRRDSRNDDYSSSDPIVFLVGGIPLIFILIMIFISRNNNVTNKSYNEEFFRRTTSNNSPQRLQALEATQTQIENKIQVNDPDFNKEEFVAWSKNLFVKLQQAWSARDWSTIRIFETESLFEQHKNQLQGYINNNQINVMDRICVNYAHLYGYRVEGDKEILTVRLNSRMEDYIIDANTKQVLKGQKGLDKVNTYLLTFIRKNGVKTKPGTIQINTTNCPNCGAPTQVTSSGKCDYCGSVITTGEYNWVLSNLERDNIN